MLPGINNIAQLADLMADRIRKPHWLPLSIGDQVLGETAQIEINEEDPHFPERHDLKAMRLDVLLATICIQNLVKRYFDDNEELTQTDLYVANGVFLETLFNTTSRIANAFKKAMDLEDRTERQGKLYKLFPPLMALNTLTTATESFVSQYTGFTGGNATLGSTSMSGFYALQEACTAIRSGETSKAVVGGSSRAGIFSYISYNQFENHEGLWRESPGTVFLLLLTLESDKQNKRTPFSELSTLENGGELPSLLSIPTIQKTAYIPQSDLAILSGGFFEGTHLKYVEQYNTDWPEIISTHHLFGSLGAVSVLVNIALGLTTAKNHDSIDCIDIDPYGRSSRITVKITK